MVRIPKNTDHKIDSYKILALSFAVIAFSFAALRANFLSITYDEAVSYSLFVRSSSLIDTLSHNVSTTTERLFNNHVLNSILMRATTYLFGDSELAIRLPALMGYILFLIGIYKILNLFLTKFHFLIGFCFIIFQPSLIDYFSCARGYGLGLGFMSIGIYFLFLIPITDIDSKRLINASASLVALLFAALSNISFLNVWTASAFIILTHEIHKQKLFKPIKKLFHVLIFKNFLIAINTAWTKLFKEENAKTNNLRIILIVILNNLLLFVLIYGNLKPTQGVGLFHADGRSFWNGTFIPLITFWLYDESQYLHYFFVVILSILAAATFVTYLTTRQKQKTRTTTWLSFTVTILALVIATIWAEHVMFDFIFPQPRMAIYLIPIFLILVLLLGAKLRESEIRKYCRINIDVIILVLLLHALTKLNLSHYYFGTPNMHTKDIVMHLEELTKQRNFPERSLKIWMHSGFEPAVDFYFIKYNLKQFAPVGELFKNYDLFYINEKNKDMINKNSLKIIRQYNDIFPVYLAVPQNSPFVDMSS